MTINMQALTVDDLLFGVRHTSLERVALHADEIRSRLASREQRAVEAEAEVARLKSLLLEKTQFCTGVIYRRMEAEARVRELEGTQERRCIEHAAVEVLDGDCTICDTKIANERVARLEAALTEIEGFDWPRSAVNFCGWNAQHIARAALAEDSDPEAPPTRKETA